LAWNGGGSSNYTEIIQKGGYVMSKESKESETSSDTLKHSIHTAEKTTQFDSLMDKFLQFREGLERHVSIEVTVSEG
jgi:hypothetical protein